jgi:hypothetical protein
LIARIYAKIDMSKLVMPFTLQPDKFRGLSRLHLINADSTEVKGAATQYREPPCVSEGLLATWDEGAARAAMSVGPSVETWYYQWSEQESYWEHEVGQCTVPEEVEALIPTKWMGYQWQTEVDETLAKVCSLCTALAEKFVALTNDGQKDTTPNKWRLHSLLKEKLQAVVELLESSIGEDVPMMKLRDPEFVRQCWNSLNEEDRHSVLSSLGEMALDTR